VRFVHRHRTPFVTFILATLLPMKTTPLVPSRLVPARAAACVFGAVLSCATHLGYSTGSTLIIDGGRAL